MAEHWTYEGPEWIYLQPCWASGYPGRTWCKDAVATPDDPGLGPDDKTDTPYVRGDLYEALQAQLHAKTEECVRLKDNDRRYRWLWPRLDSLERRLNDDFSTSYCFHFTPESYDDDIWYAELDMAIDEASGFSGVGQALTPEENPDATIWDKVGNPAPEDIAASMRREFFCEHQVPVDDCDTCADKG